MNYCVASVHCKKLNYIELIWQKILITEKRTQAAKFTSLRNHRFLGRALCGLITNLTSDGCKKVQSVIAVTVIIFLSFMGGKK